MHSITDNPFKLKKLRQDLILTLTDGRIINAKIFVGYNERILDVLNDNRDFVPIEDDEGNILIIAKSSIVTADTQQVTAFSTMKKNKDGAGDSTTIIQSFEGISPYRILELENGADMQKVRKRYLKIRELLNIRSFEDAGVDKVIISLAKLYLTQIDTAYQMIINMQEQ